MSVNEEPTTATSQTDDKQKKTLEEMDTQISDMVKGSLLIRAAFEQPYDRDSLLKTLIEIREGGYQITLWQELYELVLMDTEKREKKFNLLHKANIIDYDAIESDIQSLAAGPDNVYNQYEEEKRNGQFPKRTLYLLWEHMFMKSAPSNNELLLESLTKDEKKKREQQATLKKKYLTSLTDHILTLYRNDIIINDAFIFKCFQHNLEKILTVLLGTQQFYRVELEKGTLLDLYIVLACDLNNVKMFIKFIPEMNIHHMEYVLRYGSYDFLTVIYRYRKNIPSFDANMSMLDRMLAKKDWKLIKFFDKWRRERR